MAKKAQFYKVNYKTAWKDSWIIVPASSSMHARDTVQNKNVNAINQEFLGWQEVGIIFNSDQDYSFEANFLGYTLYYNEEALGFGFLCSHFHQEIQQYKEAYWKANGY
ncbi:hypothetical protein PWM41_000465 [Providencia rettgeri]|nr:hypothetical protein [Providencia rettgeri]